MVKGKDSGSDSGFRSQLCYFPAMEPWAIHSIPLFLGSKHPPHRVGYYPASQHSWADARRSVALALLLGLLHEWLGSQGSWMCQQNWWALLTFSEGWGLKTFLYAEQFPFGLSFSNSYKGMFVLLTHIDGCIYSLMTRKFWWSCTAQHWREGVDTARGPGRQASGWAGQALPPLTGRDP